MTDGNGGTFEESFTIEVTAPEYGTETSLADVLGADTSGPERRNADGEDFDLVWAAAQRVLAADPGSPVSVLADPEAAVTVLLPDDDAFTDGLDRLLPGRVSNEWIAATRMRQLDVATLEAVLLDHVVVGATVTSADVVGMDGEQVTTAGGTVLTVSVTAAGVRLLDEDGDVVTTLDTDRLDLNLGQVQVAHVVERLIAPR